MGLVELLVIVLVLVIVFWLVNQYIVPMVPAPWGSVIVVILALIVILYLLNAVGIINLSLGALHLLI